MRSMRRTLLISFYEVLWAVAVRTVTQAALLRLLEPT
jgi:hypothetical protein